MKQKTNYDKPTVLQDAYGGKATDMEAKKAGYIIAAIVFLISLFSGC